MQIFAIVLNIEKLFLIIMNEICKVCLNVSFVKNMGNDNKL